MKIVIGADHRGYAYKEAIKNQLTTIEWLDVGAFSNERSDYPLFAHSASKEVAAGVAQAGVLLCGSGVGMSIVANRYRDVYAALVWNTKIAQQSKEHDNANMLIIPTDYVTQEEAVAMINVWLGATFLGGRYAKRCLMIDSLLE